MNSAFVAWSRLALLAALVALGSPYAIAAVTLSTNELRFGTEIYRTSSASQLVVLNNDSEAPLSISGIVAAGDFSSTNDCGTSLQPKGGCNIRVTFTPVGRGIRTGSIMISDSADGSPHLVRLLGFGLAAVPQFSRAALGFYNQAVGATSLPETVILSNRGDLKMSIASIVVGGSFSETNDCPAVLEANAACTIKVAFKAQAAGDTIGAITVTDDAPDSPHILRLSGTTRLVIATSVPDSISFGPQLVGRPTPARRVTLGNGSSAGITFSRIDISGDFELLNGCGSTQPGLSSCSMDVTFKPTAAGQRTGALTIVTNRGSRMIFLSGEGLVAWPAPTLRALGADAVVAGSLGFDLTVSGSDFAADSVVRWNNGDRPTQFLSTSSLRVSISAGDIMAAGTAEISVITPQPGGGRSTPLTLRVLDAIPLSTQDLLYDGFSRKIYGSGGNWVYPIDPVTQKVESPISVGTDAAKLAISDDGQYLYVALNGPGAVRRVEVSTRTPGLQFSLGESTRGMNVEDMEVLPQNPTTVAISRKYTIGQPDNAGVVVYDDGIARSSGTLDHTGSNVIEFSDSPFVLYGYDKGNGFWTMKIDPAGVSTTSVDTNLITGPADIKFDQRRIYSTTGAVVDPLNRILIGRFQLPNTDMVSVVPDSRVGLNFFLSVTGNSARVLAFDQRTLAQVGGMTIAGLDTGSNKPGSLIRCSGNNFAFRTTGNQIVIFPIPDSWVSLPPELLSIPAGGGVSVSTGSAAASVQTGYARIETKAGISALSGVAIYGYHPGDYLVGETAVPAVKPIKAGRIYAGLDDRVNTGVAIANPNAEPATIDFFYTDTSGTDIGAGSSIIGPHEQIARFIDAVPFNTFGSARFEGTVSFTSSIPVGVVAIRGFYNERGDFLTSALPVVDLSDAGPISQAGIVVVPHFADGGGLKTMILLVNPTESPVRGKVEFLNDDGEMAMVTIDSTTATSFDYAVEPRSVQTLQTAGGSARISVGSVHIVPAMGPAPVSQVIFSYSPAGVVVSQAVVPSVSGRAVRTYVEMKGAPGQKGSIQSGIAVTNNSATPISFSIQLVRLDGLPVGRTMTRGLGPFGHISGFLPELFPDHSLGNTLQGVLRLFSSSTEISAVGLRSRYNENGDFLITTIPVIEETSAAASTEVLFPQFADGGGYTTQFVVFTIDDRQPWTGTLRLVAPNGELLTSPVQ